jgi:hypothetical protein
MTSLGSRPPSNFPNIHLRPSSTADPPPRTGSLGATRSTPANPSFPCLPSTYRTGAGFGTVEVPSECKPMKCSSPLNSLPPQFLLQKEVLGKAAGFQGFDFVTSLDRTREPAIFIKQEQAFFTFLGITRVPTTRFHRSTQRQDPYKIRKEKKGQTKKYNVKKTGGNI